MQTEKQVAKARALVQTVFEWLELFVLALVAVLLVLTFCVRHSPVQGNSMNPTLEEGDLLLVSGLAYTPKCGDIIIVQSPAYGLDKPLVKRVIAVGGDTLDINFETWQVTVNGTVLDEPYLDRHTGDMATSGYSIEHLTFPMTIPEGKIFAMGDNRQNSADSRYSGIGLLDERYVIGRVLVRISPRVTFF